MTAAKIFRQSINGVLIILSFLYGVDALSCRVCSEAGLDEFGECVRAFDYNCDDYARRSGSDQRVYCRTTRERARNGTYAIVKECISESAHYSTFPHSKATRLDEECDVADVDGNEIAYCLCRTDDYCNAPAIADQFTYFENKYPEFFELLDGDDSTRSENSNVEDERRNYAAAPSVIGVTSRQSSSAQPNLNQILHGRSDSDAISLTNTVIQRPISPLLPSFAVTALPPPIVPVSGNNPAAMSANTFANASPQQIPFPITVSAPATSRTLSTETLSCFQCSEANLAGETADCVSQVAVDCPANQPVALGRPLCFSRQIITPKGEFGVEKMCVPEKAVLEEFGEDAVFDGCATIDSTTLSRYCVCSTSGCNRASVAQQMKFDKLTTPSGSTTQTSAFSTAAVRHSTKPTITPLPESGDLSRLSCVSCLDADLHSPIADCRHTTQQRCRTPPGERAYCLTRQTQNGKNSFIVEKSCTTQSAFLTNFPEERKFVERGGNTVASRCASNYDGYVNFCICDSNLCNQEALTQQAEQMRAVPGEPTPFDDDRVAPILPVSDGKDGRLDNTNSGIFAAFPSRHNQQTADTKITSDAVNGWEYGGSTTRSANSANDKDDAELPTPTMPARSLPTGESERLAHWHKTLLQATADATSVTWSSTLTAALGAATVLLAL